MSLVLSISLSLASVIEQLAVVWAEWLAILDSLDQVWVGNEEASKDKDDIEVLVHALSSLDGRLGGVTSGNEEWAGVVPELHQPDKAVGGVEVVGVSVNAGLGHVEVCELLLLDLSDQVCESLVDVLLGHLHTLKLRVWRQAETDLLVSDSGNDGLGDLNGELATVLD